MVSNTETVRPPVSRIARAWLSPFAPCAVILVSWLLFCMGANPAIPDGRPPDQPAPLVQAWQQVIDDELVEEADGILVVGDALVIYSGEFGAAWALDARSHRLLWQKRGTIHSGPRAVGDRDVLVHGRDTLSLLNARTGKPRWTRQLDGFLSDDGYVTVAGSLGCVVYHSPDQAISLSSLNRRTVVDLRTGIQTHVRPTDNPFRFGLERPPRFLYEAPDLTGWSSLVDELHSMVDERKVAIEYPYSVGCLDAVTGKRLWLADLGPISNRRRPELTVLHPSLAVCRFVRATASGRSTELWWLDLRSGKVLRKDYLSVDPFTVWPVLQPHAHSETARALLAKTCLLAVSNLVLSLSRAESPEKALWTRNLKDVLPASLQRTEGVGWMAEGAWPFAVLSLRPSDSGLCFVLLVDMKRGVIRRVGSGGVTCAALSRRRNTLYVLSGNTLTGYELPTIAAQ